MARSAFGGLAYDLIAQPDADVLELGDLVTIPLYNAPGGTVQTSFLLWDGSAYTIPASSIVTDAAGYLPRFQGPDGLTSLYIQPSSGIFVELPSVDDLRARLVALEAGTATAEVIRDTIGTALQGSGVITVTPNDAGDTIVVSSTATVNSTDAQLRDRATHTGEVALNTMASDWSNTAPTDGQRIVYNAGTGQWTPITSTDMTVFATKTATGGGLNGSLRQFVDVSDTASSDGDVLQYDTASGTYLPTDLANQFAAIDSAGRLATSAEPLYFVPTIIVDEGAPIPADFPAGGIVFSRPAAPSLIPTVVGSASGTNVITRVITTAEALTVGTQVALVVGVSGEATFPSTFTLTYATGAGAITMRSDSQRSGSAQTLFYTGTITTLVPSGTALTVTSTAATLPDRQHFHAVLLRTPGLATVGAFDQQATTNANTGPVLTLTIGPTGTTAQPNELALMGIFFNSGGSAADRTIAGTNGWQQLYNVETIAGTTSRVLGVWYKALSAVGTVSGNAVITASDAASGAYAGAVITLKAV